MNINNNVKLNVFALIDKAPKLRLHKIVASPSSLLVICWVTISVFGSSHHGSPTVAAVALMLEVTVTATTGTLCWD